ncbi:MAG: hypothetical protein LBM87_07655 [Ruminococcus sp.]|nr:hypothetical protein [Ruminococcus sp.]
MKLAAKVSYLKGLMDGMNIDYKSDNGKIHKAIYDILEDIAVQVEDLQDQIDEVGDNLDTLDEDFTEFIKEVCSDEDFSLDDEDDDSFLFDKFYDGDGEEIFEYDDEDDEDFDGIDIDIDLDDEDIDIIEEIEKIDSAPIEIIDDPFEEDEDEDEEGDEDDETIAEADFGDDDTEEIIPEDSDLYEVTCPTCNDSIYLTEEMLKTGSIDCPGCGEHLEFDLSDE